MIKFRRGLIKRLIQSNYDVTVVSPRDEFSTQIEGLGCAYIHVNMDNKGVNPVNDIRLTYDLFQLYKKLKPDLVIHYTIKPNIYGSIASMLANIKSFSVIPGLGYAFINENITSKIVKFLYKVALVAPRAVWFINNDDRDVFLDAKLVKRCKVGVINGEGVDIMHFIPQEKTVLDERIRFLMISRILKDKGVYEYVEAAKLLKTKYSNVVFQLLGPIYSLNPSSIDEDEVMSWHREGILEYLGETKDVRGFISNSDCVVLPSYREGKGMTLVEAASMSKPLVATNVPGCKDVIDDGENGFLCKVKDSTDLARKMEILLNLNDAKRNEMGAVGRNKVINEFDEDIIISQYIEVIENLTK